MPLLGSLSVLTRRSGRHTTDDSSFANPDLCSLSSGGGAGANSGIFGDSVATPDAASRSFSGSPLCSVPVPSGARAGRGFSPARSPGRLTIAEESTGCGVESASQFGDGSDRGAVQCSRLQSHMLTAHGVRAAMGGDCGGIFQGEWGERLDRWLGSAARAALEDRAGLTEAAAVCLAVCLLCALLVYWPNALHRAV